MLEALHLLGGMINKSAKTEASERDDGITSVLYDLGRNRKVVIHMTTVPDSEVGVQ